VAKGIEMFFFSFFFVNVITVHLVTCIYFRRQMDKIRNFLIAARTRSQSIYTMESSGCKKVREQYPSLTISNCKLLKLINVHIHDSY